MKLIERRAAQYVRMSTDRQRYSIENQSRAIAVYAARRNLTVVRSYEDAGRSGLRIEGRDALQRLMADVRSGSADFGTILVYDVSRWGRFQDSDESAYYEFLCKEAGVRVEYCAEMFENDGSLTSTVLKNIKRAMAGEFSRELSVKVFVGQCRVVADGYFIGSLPGFGLRRQLVDHNDVPKAQLSYGEHKSISTDRTILVPGPAEEIAIVHDIYRMFVDEKLSMRRIARELNQRGVSNGYDRPWNQVSVRNVLANEKYAGAAVFNRTSRKLQSPSRRNPKEEWIRAPGAFEPVVPLARFREAQRRLHDNARAYHDNEMLDHLSALWCRERRLNAALIDDNRAVPGVNAYNEHFGSLLNAYKRIGYVGAFSSGRAPNIRMQVASQIVDRVRRDCGEAWLEERSSRIIVNEELEVAVVTSSASPRCGRNQWRFRRGAHRPDILVIVQVNDVTSTVEQFVLLPLLFIPGILWLTLSNKRLARLRGFGSTTLEPLYRLLQRGKLGVDHGRQA